MLEALPDPLVPTALHHLCAESLDRETAFEVRANLRLVSPADTRYGPTAAQ